jgi:3-oxoacyl-[acyl-carrier protein] reductase
VHLDLSGKRALITGGSAGIGFAVARTLAREGCRVAICARDSERLERARTAIGEDARVVIADVTDPEALKSAVEETARQLGGLDLLCANAGGSAGGDLLESTPEDWVKTYALNVFHAAHAVRCAVPHFRAAGGGSAVIVASVTGRIAGPSSSYGSAKAAEIHLAAVLAQELGRYRIRVNAVSPGSTLFEGGGWASYGDRHPEEFAAFAHDAFPAGRLVALDEVADAVCFVLSARGGGINGAEIPVDGGQTRPTARVFARDASD